MNTRSHVILTLPVTRAVPMLAAPMHRTSTAGLCVGNVAKMTFYPKSCAAKKMSFAENNITRLSL